MKTSLISFFRIIPVVLLLLFGCNNNCDDCGPKCDECSNVEESDSPLTCEEYGSLDLVQIVLDQAIIPEASHDISALFMGDKCAFFCYLNEADPCVCDPSTVEILSPTQQDTEPDPTEEDPFVGDPNFKLMRANRSWTSHRFDRLLADDTPTCLYARVVNDVTKISTERFNQLRSKIGSANRYFTVQVPDQQVFVTFVFTVVSSKTTLFFLVYDEPENIEDFDLRIYLPTE